MANQNFKRLIGTFALSLLSLLLDSRFCKPEKIDVTFNSFRNNHRRCSIKKVLSNVSQNSQDKLFHESLFNKVAIFFIIETPAQVFPYEFANFLKTSFLKNI